MADRRGAGACVVYLGDGPERPTMRIRDRRPRRLARAALAGAAPVCPRARREAPGPRRPTPTRPPSRRGSRPPGRRATSPGWLGLWDFGAPEQRASEEEALARRVRVRRDGPHVPAPAEPPRGRHALRRRRPGVRGDRAAGAGLLLAPRGSRGARGAGRSSARQEAGQVDGLVHLSLGATAWRARGVSLRLEDFELRMEDGTLFSTPEDLGPTAFAFVGRGRVRFSPAPPAEREQLRQFSGADAIDREVGWAFVRMHPADFHRADRDGPSRAGAGPGRAPGRGAAGVARPLPAQLHASTRRSPARPGG